MLPPLEPRRTESELRLWKQITFGGTCLNRGCIPSKTLLRHAEVIEDIKKAESWGIKADKLSFSLQDMFARKDNIIATLRGGIAYLLSKGKIDVYKGYGTIHANKKVTIQTENETKQITGEKIILNGSQPVVRRLMALRLSITRQQIHDF